MEKKIKFKLSKDVLLRAVERLSLFIIFSLLVPFLILWGTIAITFSNLPGDLLRQSLALLFGLASLLMFLFIKDLKKALKVLCAASTVLLVHYMFIAPSNDRNWLADVAIMPEIDFEGDIAKVNNIRFFKYRSNTDYDIEYDNEKFDLRMITGTDLFISYWDGLQGIAHTFVSFRFADGKTLCVSVEVRREKEESYSTAKGFFKQFELIYVIGNERDIVKVRTNFRSEETFMYPMTLTREQSQAFCRSLLKGANDLNTNPKFYNTFGQNCTTTLIDHMNDIDGINIGFNQKLLLNGVSDHFAYEMGGINNDIPFALLKSSCYISDIAKKLGNDINFSKKIRTHVEQQIAQGLQKK
jgi:hypothetical protein